MPKRHSIKPYEEFTRQEKTLVDAYCDADGDQYRNKIQSYKVAGYYFAGPPEGEKDDGRGYRAARVKADKIFKKPHIQAEVKRRADIELKALEMGIEETVARVSAMARADLMQYLIEVPVECPHCGEGVSHGIEYVFDVQRMRKDGLGPLLKDVSPTKFGTKLTFYPADAAQDRMMKYHGGFKASSDGSGNTYVDKLLVLAKGD